MKFHLTRQTREKITLDLSNYTHDGHTRFPDTSSLRSFVHQINQKNDVSLFPEKALKSSQVNAAGVIHEVFHQIFIQYRAEKKPNILDELSAALKDSFKTENVDELLKSFVYHYPPIEVYSHKITIDQYLSAMTDGSLNRDFLIEELILLWISTLNPALESLSSLFWAAEVVDHPLFIPVNTALERKFDNFPGYGPNNQSFIELLKLPAKLYPYSITSQLEYIRDNWSIFLGDFIYQILGSLDLAREEEKMGFMGGPGPVQIPTFDLEEIRASSGHDIDIEAFSEDKDWMPRLVLIAKNVFVWLDQLSKQYGYLINRLDMIPDEELYAMSAKGITGLWLIGLWQRSPASARIKKLCGNPEAAASAYSLYTYRIAEDLGGEQACEKLKEKAALYGIRLASDMVPNHMGIDSDWVIHHPEWFLSLDQSPFPSYSYSGPDLSSNENIQIQIEDHYYDHTDAAVVFRRIDKRTGETRYIYHGNDGTSMPWNDTAQLNYLDPTVREIVIQTIIEVARKFPIIRFDAAMTLAKKHIQRLWYPEPGSGGAIPSRSSFSLSRADFDKAMPEEFWREVVGRVEAEVPGTLLLAEAFWMMEGYFVRSLGMHRVYNSAFMHMLRNEDNAGYRSLMKNTIEFEPEILKRFVNFMNNPDEKTAIEQFGTGDKYFGICTLMTAMPGLPMFGHGQIEGFTEKYGMEYSRAYLDEKVDEALVERHVREIIPLLYHRELFSGVEHFAMYDFYLENGKVDENVFAFTNQLNNSKTLVVYNNRFLDTIGWINSSLPSLMGRKNERIKITRSLTSALGIRKNETGFLQFYDLTTHQYFLQPVEEITQHGFEISLNGYEHHVFVDFKIVHSSAVNNYDKVYARYGRGGIQSMEQALKDVKLEPVLKPLREILNTGFLNYLIEISKDPQKHSQNYTKTINQKMKDLANGATEIVKSQMDMSVIFNELSRSFEVLSQIRVFAKSYNTTGTKNAYQSIQKLTTDNMNQNIRWYILAAWSLLKSLGLMVSPEQKIETSLAWMEEWKVDQLFTDLCRSQGISENEIHQALSTIRLMLLLQDWYESSSKQEKPDLLKNWFSNVEVQLYLGFNRYDQKIWYNQEAFTEFLWLMQILPILQTQSKPNANLVSLAEVILTLEKIFSRIRKLDATAECQVDRLLNPEKKMID